MDQKTVFISYRRALSKHLARLIYTDLKTHGWDVFFDIKSIDSGNFDEIILNQIGARAHFILLISSNSLARCVNQGDWVLREIQEAVRLGRNIIPIIEEGADFTREINYLPAELKEIIGKKSALPHSDYFFDAFVETLRTRFLKTPEYITITMPPAAELAEVQRRIVAIDTADFMTETFVWIDIPGKGYSIAKYPITNAQFSKFIEDDGYNEQKWWTDAGWQARNDGWDYDYFYRKWKKTNKSWKQPRYWTDSKWNSTLQPVVGVSWYEAVAFCLWLSDKMKAKIILPTEVQWQYAAQGEENIDYPWGSEWDCKRCNSSVIPCNSVGTTPVNQYEKTNVSPFGTVDMSGNVWEWCLTDFHNKTNDMKSNCEMRVLRGGSWYESNLEHFRCAYRGGDVPENGFTRAGFRIVSL